jgi:hypothetical protein
MLPSQFVRGDELSVALRAPACGAEPVFEAYKYPEAHKYSEACKYMGIALLSAALVYGGITKFSPHRSARAQSGLVHHSELQPDAESSLAKVERIGWFA